MSYVQYEEGGKDMVEGWDFEIIDFPLPEIIFILSAAECFQNLFGFLAKCFSKSEHFEHFIDDCHDE